MGTLDLFHAFIEHLRPRPAILFIELSYAESSALLQIRQRGPLLKESAGLFAMEFSGPIERLWVVSLQSTRELIHQRGHILDELSPPLGQQLQAARGFVIRHPRSKAPGILSNHFLQQLR